MGHMSKDGDRHQISQYANMKTSTHYYENERIE